MLKLAAIDIGSNAVRMQVSRVIDQDGTLLLKKMEYVRFPLRLGHDVFNDNRIGEINTSKFVKLMEAFKILIDLYETDDYMALATSAMREASNGREVAALVKEKTGLEIRIIDGDEEADLINRGLQAYLTDRTYLHIDVGGGSTELNLYIRKEKVASRSFPIGSVRSLEKHDNPESWEEMRSWVLNHLKRRHSKVISIGTGGNINKLSDLAGKKPGKTIGIDKLEEVQQYIGQFSLHDRINKLELNPDRADVILPASDIYLSVMRWADSDRILVPEVGLKDGMMRSMLDKHLSESQE
ncbi:MAG: phosphatase [Cyclobacteriaceae bacterium]